ncbi:MAG: DUF1638 domain-containing protein [Acidaminococcaceae bacterium]|nr:DUF1638 domain-containing protein [Acidaminococcaceae bacterium]
MINHSKTVIIACSSLTEYVAAAQKKAGTDFPVVWLNRVYHRDPAEMQAHIKEKLAALPADTETVLVAMGFCGGSWNQVRSRFRLVLPRIDDCVSLLLQTTDTPQSNLKKMDHLYVRDKNPGRESFKAIFDRLAVNVDEATKQKYYESWKKSFRCISIMDTGINDSRRPEYAAVVKKDADWLEAEMEYVDGGTHLLEKLFSGQWDAQFLVLEPDCPVEKEEMLI